MPYTALHVYTEVDPFFTPVQVSDCIGFVPGQAEY